MNDIHLKGRCAVVTGAAQGIGFAIASRLVMSGATVSLWDQDQPLLAAACQQLGTPSRVFSQVVNVTDAKDVQRAAEETETSCGALHILVCNAGIAGATVPSWDYPIDEWQRVLDVDLNGVYFCCRAAHNDSEQLWTGGQCCLDCRQRR